MAENKEDRKRRQAVRDLADRMSEVSVGREYSEIMEALTVFASAVIHYGAETTNDKITWVTGMFLDVHGGISDELPEVVTGMSADMGSMLCGPLGTLINGLVMSFDTSEVLSAWMSCWMSVMMYGSKVEDVQGALRQMADGLPLVRSQMDALAKLHGGANTDQVGRA